LTPVRKLGNSIETFTPV